MESNYDEPSLPESLEDSPRIEIEGLRILRDHRSQLSEEPGLSLGTSLSSDPVPEPFSGPTNPYEGIGPLKFPNQMPELLPCPKNVIRGGFGKLPKTVSTKKPELKLLAPQYPPKSNDFYELTSDGHFSEKYFENNKLRFRTNPNLSSIAVGLSLPQSQQELVADPAPAPAPVPDRIYIGTGNYRQANEPMSPVDEDKQPYRHKNVQMPTLPGSRPWQEEYHQREGNSEDILRVGLEEMLREQDPGQAKNVPKEENTQENGSLDEDRSGEGGRESSPTHSPSKSLRCSEVVMGKKWERNGSEEKLNGHGFERGKHGECAREGRQVCFGVNAIADTERETNEENDLEKGKVQCTPQALEERQNQAIVNNFANKPGSPTDCIPAMEFPHSGACTNMPGDRSGDNSRTGRTRTQLESKILPENPEHTAASDDISLTLGDSIGGEF